jgi:hypothetical protein
MAPGLDGVQAVSPWNRHVQVSPGHVVAGRKPGYGPGMSRARGVHPVRNHEAMPTNPPARGWIVGLERRAGSAIRPYAIQEVETYVQRN